MRRWKSNLRKLRGRRAALRRERIEFARELFARIRREERRRKQFEKVRLFAAGCSEFAAAIERVSEALRQLGRRYRLSFFEIEADRLTITFEPPAAGATSDPRR